VKAINLTQELVCNTGEWCTYLQENARGGHHDALSKFNMLVKYGKELQRAVDHCQVDLESALQAIEAYEWRYTTTTLRMVMRPLVSDQHCAECEQKLTLETVNSNCRVSVIFMMPYCRASLHGFLR
jgi:hypothetical protein